MFGSLAVIANVMSHTEPLILAEKLSLHIAYPISSDGDAILTFAENKKYKTQRKQIVKFFNYFRYSNTLFGR